MGVRAGDGREPGRAGGSGPNRIPEDSSLFGGIIPALLLFMAVVTLTLIVLAVGVILRALPLR